MQGRYRRYRTVFVLIALLIGLPAVSQAQDLARGEEIFQLCAECHGPQGHGTELFLAPSIGGLPLWYVEGQLTKFRDDGRGAHFDDIPGMRMRPMAKSLRNDRGDDLKDVAAWVSSLPAEKPAATLSGGDPAKGQTYYAVCQACHGAAGEGVPGTNAPPLAYQDDWYILSSLQRFKSGARGSSPSDAFGAVMRGMAATLPDQQAMLDVVAYIMTLQGQ